MKCQFVLCAAVILLISAVHALTPVNGRNRTLIFTFPTFNIRHWIDRLQDHGHRVTLVTSHKDVPSLIHHEERRFDHILLLHPSYDELSAGPFHVKRLAHFIQQGGNVLLACDENCSDHWRNVAENLAGVRFEPSGTVLMDHFNVSTTEEQVVLNPLTETWQPTRETLLGPFSFKQKDRLVYTGIGHRLLLNEQNPTAQGSRHDLVWTVLHAPSTALSSTRSKDVPLSRLARTGNDIGLVSLFQTRNNARFTLLGSLSFFEEKSSSVSLPGYENVNERFGACLLSWTVHAHAVLRLESVQHRPLDAEKPYHELHSNTPVYRIQSPLFLQVSIQLYQSGHWQSWKPSSDAVMVSMTMLDPYLRQPLPLNHTHFTTTLLLPDVYGVFTLSIHTLPALLTRLQYDEKIVIRPFYHDEYPRFLVHAYPYYLNVASVMVAVWVLVVILLSESKTVKKGVEKVEQVKQETNVKLESTKSKPNTPTTPTATSAHPKTKKRD